MIDEVYDMHSDWEKLLVVRISAANTTAAMFIDFQIILVIGKLCVVQPDALCENIANGFIERLTAQCTDCAYLILSVAHWWIAVPFF